MLKVGKNWEYLLSASLRISSWYSLKRARSHDVIKDMITSALCFCVYCGLSLRKDQNELIFENKPSHVDNSSIYVMVLINFSFTYDHHRILSSFNFCWRIVFLFLFFVFTKEKGDQAAEMDFSLSPMQNKRTL